MWYLKNYNLDIVELLMSELKASIQILKNADNDMNGIYMLRIGFSMVHPEIRNKQFLIIDNGGEIIIQGINQLFDVCVPLGGNEDTVAYRIKRAVCGLPIDYDYKPLDKDDLLLVGQVVSNFKK